MPASSIMRKIFGHPNAFAHLGAHPDLFLEVVIDPGLIVAHFDRRVEITDDIDMARHASPLP